MHWTQILYLGLLLASSGAAINRDRWVLVIVMWMNFSGTFTLESDPFAVGVLDIACAVVLTVWGERRGRIIAAIYVPMALLYRFEEQLGHATLYGIVDALAYAQMSVMGAGGFGSFARSLGNSLFGMHRPDSGVPVGGRRDDSGGTARSLEGVKERGVSK